MNQSTAGSRHLSEGTNVDRSTSVIHRRGIWKHKFRKNYGQTRTIYRLDGFLKSSKIHQRLSQSIKMI